MPLNKLKDISISEITLCKAGINGLEFIAKSATEPARMIVPITKTDKVKKLAVGVVYQPDTPDKEGDMATAEEIEKAAWSAMKNRAVVNKAQHGSEPVQAFIAESYIAKAGDPDGFPAGAWAVAVKVEDDALWAEIEKGDLAAFSMGGVAAREPVGKSGEAAPVAKGAYVDASVFATGLADSLKLLQAVSTALGETVEKVGEIAKTLAERDGANAEAQAAMRKTLDEVRETVEKVATLTTTGRSTTPTPGAPKPNPSLY